MGAAALSLCFASCKKEVVVEKTKTEHDTIVVKETDTVVQEPMDSVAMNKAWAEYATPGDMHKMLASEAGKWDVTMTFWMAEGAPPQTDKSVAECKMVMGGRYQETTYKGKMMGMDWEGKSTVAYNNKSKQITSTFIDNSGTGMMVAMGEYDPATKAFNLKGESIDPMTGKTVKYREVYTFVNDNSRKMEMFEEKDGKPEYKSLELAMIRK